ncbi:efflux RND transporter permease subunit [Candidatus Symbiobacter mobilis]|uniref:Efflux pump membrane transporter n=1 Tax=Candidatus Symbiobacter mobilis CR TaxID=946483 RepID=U5N4L8_9BURK|nr:efflux RND transporter permease subunit [Candidatus Symbiobacter mobilis]AGX86282.1 multidrug efflux pump [Candidatus Symbiobacter mobilis CR]
MAHFFIDRPIFAWVIALFLLVAGTVSITQLPIAQYPPVAPATIVVSATYPGASAKTLDDSVLSIIEQEMNGAPGLVYMESAAQANGTGSITLSFQPGTNADLAQVDVQNRLARATPRLPSAVTQQGVRVDKARGNFLLFTILSSDNPAVDPVALGDYAARSIVPELQRLPGVGQAQLFGTERAMRVWIDPAKLVGLRLSMAEVLAAIRAQNVQVPAGEVGALPALAGQGTAAAVVVVGQLGDVEQFERIVLRANPDGSHIRLRDVARVELGAQAYATSARLNGQPSVGIGVQLAPSGNALATAQAVRERMTALQAYFPQGVRWSIPYDSSRFVATSLQQVLHTLVEAVALVFLVMFLFLQNWRYTLIPTLVVPITLLGTCTALLGMGFSINVLTMFAMVLVIGIVVDDAIVVVENVERIMSEEGLPPPEATRKAMGQISGAVVGVTVVLISVFVPLAFFQGSMGNIYRQFSAVMGVSIAISAFLALSFTPALCASLLQPVQAGHHLARSGFFGRFNRGFSRVARSYERGVARLFPRAGRTLAVYLAIAIAAWWMYHRLPSAFLPDEDQGNVLVNVQLPAGATKERALAVIERVEKYMLEQPQVEGIVTVLGYSFSGQGQNAALAFVTLKDWAQRPGSENSSQSLAGRAFGALADIRDASIFPLNPPPIPELGSSSGFSLRLQDRGGRGHDALLSARNRLQELAGSSKLVMHVRSDGLEDAPQLQIDIDRDKAGALGVDIDTLHATLSALLGSSYVNDFPNAGRMQRVIVQADALARMQGEDVLRFHVPNRSGQLVPLSSVATTKWVTGMMQAVRYNGYPAMRISGQAAAGYSTGDAMAEMERLAAQLPEGMGIEWTGTSREEKVAGSQAALLYGFAVLSVFLCLAALYESWSIPVAVVLVVPLGVFGVILATLLRGYTNDVYFQVGLVTIIGLSAKNAILIIEFAKDLHAQGKAVITAALEAAHLRFRPIVMTSLAFTLGVLPLALATGAGSASQRAIGTGVIGGIIAGTTLAVVFVPIFFVVVRTLLPDTARQREIHAQQAAHMGVHAPVGGDGEGE